MQELAPQGSLAPHQRLWLIVFVGFVVIFGMWARFHFTNLQINRDATSEPSLVAAKENAQALLQALEKYRADNGLYPTTLDQLTPKYAGSIPGLHGYRYLLDTTIGSLNPTHASHAKNLCMVGY